MINVHFFLTADSHLAGTTLQVIKSNNLKFSTELSSGEWVLTTQVTSPLLAQLQKGSGRCAMRMADCGAAQCPSTLPLTSSVVLGYCPGGSEGCSRIPKAIAMGFPITQDGLAQRDWQHSGLSAVGPTYALWNSGMLKMACMTELR